AVGNLSLLYLTTLRSGPFNFMGNGFRTQLEIGPLMKHRTLRSAFLDGGVTRINNGEVKRFWLTNFEVFGSDLAQSDKLCNAFGDRSVDAQPSTNSRGFVFRLYCVIQS